MIDKQMHRHIIEGRKAAETGLINVSGSNHGKSSEAKHKTPDFLKKADDCYKHKKVYRTYCRTQCIKYKVCFYLQA